MIVFLLFIFLPVLEISGFVLIGGDIGLGWSLLWLTGATMAGVYFLTTMGQATMKRARAAVKEEEFPFEEMFDGICTLLGGLLLIFPGFFSDFLALPLLLPPARHILFRFLKYQHRGVFNDLRDKSEGFTAWYYEEKKSPPRSETIEGDFKRIDKAE